MDIKRWKTNVLVDPRKKAMPILSFPCVQLMGVTVKQLIASSELQAEGMKKVCERTDSLASLSMMDLSVEAEAFGAKIKKTDNEAPTVIQRVINRPADADKLVVPDVAAAEARTSQYIKAIEQAVSSITDRPVLAGVTGPFSLAGRLMDMSEIMINCYENPDMVNTTLEKTTEFITDYILEFKKAGANGVVMADPSAGLLSHGLFDEFVSAYVKKIIDRVKDDEFLFVYHNCGPNTHSLLPSIIGIGADAYHFGDTVKMPILLKGIPGNVLVMGNISPAAHFRGGTPESIYTATTALLQECSAYKNFVISSGCDIPPMSPWANIDSFFKAVNDFYQKI